MGAPIGVATERIKSGMMLAVDGDAGTVTLVDEVDEQAETRIEAQSDATDKRQKTIVGAIVALVISLVWWRKTRNKI